MVTWRCTRLQNIRLAALGTIYSRQADDRKFYPVLDWSNSWWSPGMVAYLEEYKDGFHPYRYFDVDYGFVAFDQDKE